MNIENSRDVRLVGRAVKSRWAVPERLREQLVIQLETILGADGVAEQTKVAAARVILEADKLNLEQEKRDGGVTDKCEVTINARPGLSPDAFAGFLADVAKTSPANVPPDGGTEPIHPEIPPPSTI